MKKDLILLKNINCIHFKNHTASSITFSEQTNFIVGDNGAGKTNVLDMIHYLALTKSAFSTLDGQNIQHGKSSFLIQGTFHKADKIHAIKCSFQQKKGKVLKNNNKVYTKLRDHIGLSPIVLIMPHDIDLIRGGSELRRKFFDGILCQLNQEYLHHLMTYNHILAQRNGLLRLYGTNNFLDRDLLNIYNEQLISLNQQIAIIRASFITTFLPHFMRYHNYLSSNQGTVHLQYVSQVTTSFFIQDFTKSLQQDLSVQRTTVGIHRDDFLFLLNNHPLKRTGSQGEQKTFVMAIRLAQFACMYDILKFKPLLVLDDIFDKLDEKRIAQLIQLITAHSFGQVFITDADEKRGTNSLQQITTDRMLIKVKNGSCMEKILPKQF